MKTKFTALVGATIVFHAFSFVQSAQAQMVSTVQLPNTGEVQKVTNVFSSLLRVRTAEPPSEPGRFGFGVGIAASVTTTSQISSLLVSNSLPIIPFGNAYATLYAPLGITVEFGGLPPLSIASVRMLNVGGNIRWTFTRLLGDWFPVNLAAEAHMTYSSIGYSQVVNSVNVDVSARSMQLGLSAMVSKQLLFFEPYFAAGIINQSSTMESSGPQSIFTFTNAPVNVATFSPHIRAGAQFKFFVFVIGAEYEFAYSNHTGVAKIGFKI